MALEKTVPQWDAAGTEPPSSLKTTGWQAGQKPASAYFNWFWHSVSECLTELQSVCGKASGIPVVAATSTDGVTYTATVDDITELTAGLAVIFVPNTTSTSISTKFNLNGLGDKFIRQSVSSNTTTGVAPANANWLTANKPVLMIYNGTQWMTQISRSNAADLYGTVAIEKGGTGATDAATARENLGAAAKDHTQAASTVSAGTFAGQVVANANAETSYETYQVRNAAILSATPSSMTNGEIAFVYS